VLSCTDSTAGQETAHNALAELCKIYWRPIFAFVCRRGYSIPDAQDLTQDFFLVVLEGNLLKRADPNLGRFRSLLLKALQNFLTDDTIKKHARKRGGDVKFVSWDEWMAEAPSRLSIPKQTSENWSAERVFDLHWAATVVERALRRLADECEGQGRRKVFDILNGALCADRDDVSYADLAKQLGVHEEATKRLLYQLRQRYRTLLREEVAGTVDQEATIDDEIRYLCAALSRVAQAA
jgi:RNA polymerase sigma-70 factor (ECF subfamily)